MDFSGKIAVVTGGGGGIGRATSLGFAQNGAKVVVVDQDASLGEGTVGVVKQAGGEALFVPADVTKSADVQGYVRAALDRYGRIDLFFNNAGVEGTIAPTAEYDEEVFDRVIAVNVRGVFLGLRHVLPVMLKQGGGAIVNTASVAGLTASPGMPAYVASKHAVIGLTKTAAGEVAAQGIRVNAVCPGPIDTRMIHSLAEQRAPGDTAAFAKTYAAMIPRGEYGKPEEIAALVLFLCSDGAANMTGGHYVSDGGRSAVAGSPGTIRT